MEYKINNLKIVIILTILINLILLTGLQAQQVSAEFISELGPPSLTTGQKVKDGVQHVYYHNNILYVIDVWAGIQVVDISNINEPKEIGRFHNDHRAHNLYIDDDYGYLSDELSGVTILDLTNPKAPIKIGQINTEGDAWWVIGQYPYVYVAEGEKGVGVYSISDVSNPRLLSYFDTPGWAWELELEGNTVYVGDKSGGLQIIDFTNKENPTIIGQFSDPSQAKSIHIEDDVLFLTDGPNGLYILDISNQKFPSLISKIEVEGFIFDVFKGGKYAYMANESTQKLDIINLTDMKNPRIEASYKADDKIFGVWKEDVYVFVAANNKTLILRHNSPPILAAIDSQTVDEQVQLTITPQGYDPDGDEVYYAVENMPEGAVFDSVSGILSWTPTYEEAGIYENVSIRIIERTLSQLSTEQVFQIKVNHVNRAPTLPEIDNFSVNENETLSFDIPEGSDPDKEDTGQLIYLAENLPDGAAFDSTTRRFLWTPSYEQSGTYSIDFLVKDPPGATDRNASTITVIHVDRKPIITAVENKIINENQSLEFTITGTDPDKEDQNLISFTAQNLPEGASFDSQNLKFSWTPTYEQSGVYKDILIIMTAGNLSDSITWDATVTHISRPPILDAIALQMVDEQSTLTFSVSGSDSDGEDQDKLVYSVSNLPQGASFNQDSLTVSWTPTYEQAGEYPDITFTVTDGSNLTASRSTKITVNHVNRPPVLNEVQPQTVDENTPMTFDISGSDPDNEDQESLTYSSGELPPGAKLEGNSFSWTPTFDQSGEYTIEFLLTDGQLTDKKTAQVTVNHINRPPAIEPVEAQIVDENQPLEFKIVGNDPDTEDAGKWVITVGQLPQGAQYATETGTFTWIPTFEQAGSYTVIFTNTDEQGLSVTQEVGITVNHINRTPVFNPMATQSIDENAALNFEIPPAEDPDSEDAQKLTYSTENLPDEAVFDPQTRIISWTPSFEQSGSYEIQISVSDGEYTVVQPLMLTVNHINRTPEIETVEDQTISENSEFSFTVKYTDPDKEDEGALVLASTNLPQGSVFNTTNGEFTWTPDYEQAGNYQSITLTVTDPSGLSATQSFNITVNNVNREPSIQSVEKLTVAENTSLSQQFIASDPDQEDQGLLKFSSNNLPEGSVLDPSSGTLSWTPNFTQAGTYTVNIMVTDVEKSSAEISVAIEVTNVNRLPSLQAVENKEVDENNALTFTIVASDEDSDDQLTYSAENLPSGASIDAQSGTFSWTPGFEQAGEYPITIKVSDGESEDFTDFTIKVNNRNRAPIMEGSESGNVTVGESIELSFSANDPDGDNITFESPDLPDGANLDANTGQFTWQPSESQVGTFNFTIRVNDGTDTAETSGSINVSPKPQEQIQQN